MERVFADKASGKDVRRPRLEELLRFIRDGDTLVVHSMDQLARNLDDPRSLVQAPTRQGVRDPAAERGAPQESGDRTLKPGSTAQGRSSRTLRAARAFSLSRLKSSVRRGTANRASPATWKSTVLVSRQVLAPVGSTR